MLHACKDRLENTPAPSWLRPPHCTCNTRRNHHWSSIQHLRRYSFKECKVFSEAYYTELDVAIDVALFYDYYCYIYLTYSWVAFCMHHRQEWLHLQEWHQIWESLTYLLQVRIVLAHDISAEKLNVMAKRNLLFLGREDKRISLLWTCSKLWTKFHDDRRRPPLPLHPPLTQTFWQSPLQLSSGIYHTSTRFL